MVVKIYLESMSYESIFGAATEMVGFEIDKGPELSLAPETFFKYISLHQYRPDRLLNDTSQTRFCILLP